MTPFVHRILSDHPHHPSSTYVFCNPNGTKFHDIRGSFVNALRRAGLPHITFHGMRHIYATRLGQKADVWSLQEILGHRDVRSTSRYIHPVKEAVIQAANSIQLGDLDDDQDDDQDDA